MQQSPESPMSDKHLKLVTLKELETDIVRKNGFSPPYSLPFIFGLAYLLFSFIANIDLPNQALFIILLLFKAP